MLGEFSNADGRASRITRAVVVRASGRRTRAVPGLERRLRASGDIPASGQIVFRAASQILR